MIVKSILWLKDSLVAEQHMSNIDPALLDPNDKDFCLLSEELQRRNTLIYIFSWCAIYFVGPVTYVGVMQANIIKSFGGSDFLANLPSAVNAWVLPTPVILAWLLTSTKYMRPMLVGSYFALSAIGFITAAVFFTTSNTLVISALVIHAALTGIINGIFTMCMWEMLGRGMSTRRRGKTLSIAFTIGPMFAVLGSMAASLILTGEFLNIKIEPIERPWTYITIYGITGPVMLLLALLSSGVTIPPREEKDEHLSFRQNFAGIKEYLGNPLILLALFGFLLTYAGSSYIMNNVGLYVKDVTGEAPEVHTGTNLALRFGCKCAFGFILGLLMVRYNPRVPVLVTTGTCIVGIIWALFVPGKWYLASFGWLGAGELFYLYYMNYIVLFARPEQIRQYTAYTSLFPVLMGFVAGLYGFLSDKYGYRESFWLALVFLSMAMSIAIFALPNHVKAMKRPEE
ncbi:MAG: MFS transporter [Planctomycetaceae bacterium]